MPIIDLPSLTLGLLAAALPLLFGLWRLQARRAAERAEAALQAERLSQAQLAQAGLCGQIDALREENLELNERNAAQMARLAGQDRELALLRDALALAQSEQVRQAGEQGIRDQELRQLERANAALSTELREQQANQQQRLDDLQGARDTLRAQFAELAAKIFDEREQRFAQTSQERMGQLLDPLRERIQAFEKRVEESYQNEARERFSLSKELERLQQLNLRLGDEARHLTQALRGQKTQGNWGELILERVLEGAGLEKGREYQTQVSLRGSDGERFQPDVILQLPGERQIIIDAKVSLTAYQLAVASEDETARQHALRQHLLSLRSHLKGLSVKQYQRLEGLHSLDFVLLFVPIEAAFAAALQSDPQLFQEAYEQHIVIVSPTTLLATLRVVDSLWRQERQGQNAREIAERAGALYDKFVAFVADLDEIGLRAQQLDKAYAAARNKLVEGRGNLIGRAENLKQLGARASKSLPPELLEKAAVPELDATQE
jgi:DNA recombination protein RmuC